MQKLAKREEQIMQVFWQLGKAFIKEVIPEMPEPKPHYNSLATMVKILEDKGFLAHETVGNIFQYYPLVSKDEYQRHSMKDIVSQYFDNSYSNMLAFFAKEQNISNEELNVIINLIKDKKMIPYSLHAAIIITACLLFYRALLHRQTYYVVNRFILAACLFLAFLLPLIPIPQQFSFRASRQAENSIDILDINSNVQPSAAQPSETNSINKITKPVIKSTTPRLFSTIEITKWFTWLYWFGVAIFGVNFLVQIIVLLYQSYTKPSIKDGSYRIVELSDDKAPCSFGNSIFINPGKYDWDTYNQILIHEKVHIRQRHSIDIILAELMLVTQWFNPFAWFYRKEVENNLEYLTDQEVLRRYPIEPENYQVGLLKVSIPNYSMRIATNYNQSLLKSAL